MTATGVDKHQPSRLMRVSLRAYPPRWHRRQARNGAPFPDHGQGVAGAINTIAGGLRYRRTDRPPFRSRAGVDLRSEVPAAEWHEWYRDVRVPSRMQRWLRFVGHVVIHWTIWTIFWTVGGLPTGAISSILLLISVHLAVAVLGIAFSHKRYTASREAEVRYALCYDPFAGELPYGPWIRPPWPDVDPAGYKVRAVLDFGFPVGIWATVAGAALIGGAAWPNEKAVVGPLQYTPDPNSPLTANAVGVAAIGVAVTAMCTILVIAAVARRRSRSGKGALVQTAGPSWSMTKSWTLATVLGLPATVAGLSGTAPDLGCVLAGAILILGGRAVLTMRITTTPSEDGFVALVSTA